MRADVTVRQAGRRVNWQFNTMATTTFADGQSVTGIGDFGQARSDRKGVLRLSVGTPFGAHHSIELTMSRSNGPGHCRVLVAG